MSVSSVKTRVPKPFCGYCLEVLQPRPMFPMAGTALRSATIRWDDLWTSIGTVGTVLLSPYLFGEPADPARLFFTTMITAGVAGLKIATH